MHILMLNFSRLVLDSSTCWFSSSSSPAAFSSFYSAKADYSLASSVGFSSRETAFLIEAGDSSTLIGFGDQQI